MGLKIQPLSDRVVVTPQAAETKTASGLYIPDSAKEKPQQGTIAAVGNGKKDHKMTVKVGDTVLYGKYAGTELKLDGKEYLIKKLSTENNELYGSVKPTEISKIIQETNQIEIKPSMIQPVTEIKSLGKFKVKISLHSEVDAEIMINVESAESIQ